ncbi:6-methylsalicylic acid decarboxylase atA [Fulvia fulva]|uniref:6-methylsalicylic acid decarboxylase atA n=1 Tax=Passalora fulva TaxID=5499 RepID=A0A9Q8PJX8_PASFU|nr:6-methylsalicylic acid decarboxylase atA [Fulvia fulva]KAK4612055.1 6-methylsalicylic acid decarboxylase atA [Fulvia fulva]UJO23901.1 6-methylsalicylic acid decarboxylase atA [Fulvia fulva]WPV20904.1 6-methylsalicylic acid decarboxylase atA [Fulvia fulva]WPV36374.1 6-methylsalicylic acid decarboxylase atA [Fulvia fulva]
MAPTYKPDPRNYSIAVVGGGIGGLCTAIGLLHQAINVTIYEAASRLSELGFGVSLAPNATRALQLIEPAMYAGFLKARTNNAWPDRQQFWFSFRAGEESMSDGQNYGKRFFDQHCETGQSSVHRANFLDELVALVPKEIARFGKRLVDLEDNGEDVTLRFADGSTARHSAVIGCDGIKSVVRQFVLGKNDPATYPVVSGKYAYRGLVPMEEAAGVLGDELARNSQIYVGHGGHILTFPIQGGKTMNAVAFGTKEDGEWRHPEWVIPMDKEAMLEDFKGWIAPAQQILGLMRKGDIWALFDHPPAHTYTKGRVYLLGDAAHASTPHNGAGAGQAVEDALILAQVMALVYNKKDIPRALSAYDKVRRPRSQRLVKESRVTGLLYDLQAPKVEDDLEKVAASLKVNKIWLWNHDHEAEIKKVQQVFLEESAKL